MRESGRRRFRETCLQLRPARALRRVFAPDFDAIRGPPDRSEAKAYAVTFTLEKKIVLGLAAAAGVLAFTGGAAWWTSRQMHEAFHWVEHTHGVRSKLERVQVEVLSLQGDVRAFSLTGAPLFQRRSEDGAAVIERLLGSLREDLVDSPGQLERLTRLEGAIAEASRLASEAVDLRRREGPEALMRSELEIEGTEAFGAVRAAIEGLEAEEDRLLRARSEQMTAVTRRMTWVVSGATGLSVLLLGSAIYVVQRDFRLLNAAGARVRQSSARYEDLYNRAPCGYHSLDAEGRFLAINDTELAWLGYTREEVVGRMRFTDLLTPAGLETFGAAFPKFKRDGRVEGLEFEWRRKDGTILPILLSATAVYDADGNYVSSRSTAFDISARRETDRRIQELNTDLRRRNAELEAVNRELEAFSYSVSHDLRAPLRHIDGFAGLLLRRADRLDESGRRHLEVIAEAARKMGRLIDDLLAFSRMSRARLAHETVDTGAMVAEIVRRFEGSEAAAAARVDFVVGELPAVQGDRAMLRQVWFNLIDNAVKYSSREERARVEIGAVAAGGAEVVFHVRDNGVGFDMKYADKLFGVFQRLHSPADFDGTGIGLANVRRIVTRHGGRTWAEAAVGEGACFYFSLPVHPVCLEAGPAAA
jgi:PAS domain S-box-containing protein